MHAYLLAGREDIAETEEILHSLTDKFHARTLEYPITKIEEVRTLRKVLRTQQPENTIFLIRKIDSATKEAQNAFLKSLEEPPKNVLFLLTAENLDAVPSTIISRCQILSRKAINREIKSDLVDSFLTAKTSSRLQMIDAIRKREDAIEFIENLILILHQNLKKEDKNFKELAIFLTESQEALTAIKANGNVSIHLTNLVVKLDQTDLPDIMDKV